MVDDKSMIKAQLIAELEEMRRENAELRRQVEESDVSAVERRLAVERVRAEAMGMQTGDDLCRVVVTLHQEMRKLGIESFGCNISFINEQANRVITYFTTPESIYADLFHSEVKGTYDDLIVLQYEDSLELKSDLWMDTIAHWHQGEPTTFRDIIKPGDSAAWFKKIYGIEVDTSQYDLSFLIGEWFVTNIPFQHGIVGFREKSIQKDHIIIVQTLADSLSLGYLRFLDFQRLEKQNQSLKEANQQIQENTRRKSDFLARMSHDLRTPMNAIIGYTRILLRRLRDTIEPRQLRNLENIDTSAHNLLNLINEILDLSRVEAGRIDVHPQPVDLQQLVVECAAAIEPLIQAEVQLIQNIEAVPSLSTDGEILRKVLMNLLGNAVKFTDTAFLADS